MKIRLSTTVGGTALLALSFGPLASAQAKEDFFDRESVQPVSERSDPAYTQTPIRSGSFNIRPEVVFSGGLNSNTLATEQDEMSDSSVGFTPSISFDSDWARHGVGAYVEVDHREFSDLENESRTNAKIKLRGRLDLGQNAAVSVVFVGADETEDRTALSTVATSIEPNEYTTASGRIGFEHEAGRLQFETSVGLATFDYDDTELEGDLFQDQNFRDRDELSVLGRVAFAMTKDVALYAKATHTEAEYTPPNIFTLFNRDYSGSVLLVGTDFEFGDKIRGDLGVGYQNYTYDDATFEDISDVAFAGHLDWMVTGNTTLSAEAARAVIDPGVVLTNAAMETGASVRLEQGLTPRLAVSGEAGFTQYEFETIDRDDDRVDLRLGANWKVNRSMWLDLGYEVIDQTSDVQAFTDNRVMLKMRIFP
ncbi:MAG: outer membrane beta-barrel protein [Pseudomonadota bacterium]